MTEPDEKSTPSFLNKKDFSKLIESKVLKAAGGTLPARSSYLDAILELCEENNIDVRDAQKYISFPIKKKLETEAEDLHLLKYKRNKLYSL
jgi:hypothetical protein|tara:strand:+ start:3441 stop:3713 length:273 start_codon:yes stop_codon:yes gene_type:complete